MTNSIWKVLTAAIESIEDAPQWLKKLAQLTCEEALRLPELENSGNNEVSTPTVEEKLVNKDYLEFLEEQIRLEPRGPEWTQILGGRLTALRPFLNRTVLTASFFCKPESATLRIDPQTGALVHAEFD